MLREQRTHPKPTRSSDPRPNPNRNRGQRGVCTRECTGGSVGDAGFIGTCASQETWQRAKFQLHGGRTSTQELTPRSCRDHAEIAPRSRRDQAEKGGRTSAQEWKEGNGAVNPDYDERRYDGYCDGVHAVLRRLNENVINQAHSLLLLWRPSA